MSKLSSKRLAETFRTLFADPAAHRRAFLGEKEELLPPQTDTIRWIEGHVARRTGRLLAVRSARQTMKSECSAMLSLRALTRYHGAGGALVRAAPTWKPQAVISKQRLEDLLARDPFQRLLGWRLREGYVFESGKARVKIISAGEQASVVGETASILLDVDEAHTVSAEKFHRDLAPMRAARNAPCVLWGVAGARGDLLYNCLAEALGRDPAGEAVTDHPLARQYPASLWCEISPDYAAHYEEQKRILGENHPALLTQYDLVDVDALGGFFSRAQVESILSGDHPRLDEPRDGATYGMTIDLAGESEQGEVDDPIEKSRGSRDSTAAWIFEIDRGAEAGDWPLVRLADLHWWTGRELGAGPSGLPGQQEALFHLVEKWRPAAVVIDARGVGEQAARFLARRSPSVFSYKASAASVSEDCHALHALVNNGRLRLFRDDGSPEYAEAARQLAAASREVAGEGRLKIVKSSSRSHIDMVKALSYVPRCLERVGGEGGGGGVFGIRAGGRRLFK